MVLGLIASGIGGLLGGVGEIAESGMDIYGKYKNLELDLLKKTVDIGLDGVNKGVGILGGGISAYNQWKMGRLQAKRQEEYQKEVDKLHLEKLKRELNSK